MKFYRILPLVAALALGAAPPQIEPVPLQFAYAHAYASMYGFGSTTDAFTFDQFDVQGDVEWVRFDFVWRHERTSQAQNYDSVHTAEAWNGNEPNNSNDCDNSSKVRLRTPSNFWFPDLDGSYPFAAATLPTYPQDEWNLTQFDPPATQSGRTMSVTLRHAGDWAAMLGSGTWDLTGLHTATIGYGDEVAGHCVAATTYEGCNVGTCAPGVPSILRSVTDNWYASIIVTCAYRPTP